MTQHWRGVGTRGIQGMIHTDNTPHELLTEVQAASQQTQAEVADLHEKSSRQEHFREKFEERFKTFEERINEISARPLPVQQPFVMPEIPVVDLKPIQNGIDHLKTTITVCKGIANSHDVAISALNTRTAEFQERMDGLDHVIAAIQVPHPVKQNHYPAIAAIVLAIAGIALHYVS